VLATVRSITTAPDQSVTKPGTLVQMPRLPRTAHKGKPADFVCPVCGYTFGPGASTTIGRPRVYCSAACRQEGYRRRRWDQSVNVLMGNTCRNYWQ
jgi:hypothetical protein